MTEIKVELYHNDAPYNIQSNIYSPEHVKNIIDYHLQKYAPVKNEIIKEGGVLKIDISDCDKNEPPCIHYESGLHGLSKELEEKIISMNLFGLQGNL